MKYFPLLILMQIIHTGGWAQSPDKQVGVHTHVPSEQRRAELRLLLGTPHGRETSVSEVETPNKSIPATRQLSAQERKNLRLQLQGQRDNVRFD